MPLLVGFVLVALFIWIAENIGTFTAAWMYPNQRHGWSLVSIGKLGAWYLLMIISYMLVALLNRPQAMAEADRRESAPSLALVSNPCRCRDRRPAARRTSQQPNAMDDCPFSQAEAKDWMMECVWNAEATVSLDRRAS